MKALRDLLMLICLTASPVLAADPPPGEAVPPADTTPSEGKRKDASPGHPPADDDKPAPKGTPGTSEPPAKPTPRPARTRLPDGAFEATLAAGKPPVVIDLSVTAGFVTSSEARWGQHQMALAPSGAPDAPELRLAGKRGRDYLRLDARFDDDEIATGNYQGVIGGRVVSGSWTLYRR